MNQRKNSKIDGNELIKHESIEYKFKDLVNIFLKPYQTVNHKIYKKVVKKVQRKYYRQKNSILLNQLEFKYPRIESRTFIDNQVDYEDSDKEAKQKEHQLWIERENLAQIEFKAKKENEERLKFQKEQKEKLKPQPNQENKASNNIFKLEKKHVENIIDLSFYYNKPICIFFKKTGVCKYGNLCNRSHQIDYSKESLTTLIIPNMYKNMLLGYELLKLDNVSDEALEYDEEDILQHFKNFYDDVKSEMDKFGKVIQFLVCSNYQPHLRGNLYVQYEREKDAKKAYEALNGRFYAGKQITCFFSHVKNWKQSVCSLFLKNKCEKSQTCNYMHVFQNPYNEFQIRNLKERQKVKVEAEETKYNKWSSSENDDFNYWEDNDSSYKENLYNDKNKKLKKNRHKKRYRSHSPIKYKQKKSKK